MLQTGGLERMGGPGGRGENAITLQTIQERVKIYNSFGIFNIDEAITIYNCSLGKKHKSKHNIRFLLL